MRGMSTPTEESNPPGRPTGLAGFTHWDSKGRPPWHHAYEGDPDLPDLTQTPTGWIATRDDFPRIGILGLTRDETEQSFREARAAWRQIPKWRPQDVKTGDLLIATTATGEERECLAASGYEGTHHGGNRKVHDFPVIWVRFTTKGDRLPWPVESLRPCG